MAIREWGEEVWEEKIKEQGALGVIHGTIVSEEFLKKGVNNFFKMFKKEFNPILKRKSKVLDAGVGPLANYSIGLSKLGHMPTGVDISKTTINSAANNVKKNKVKMDFIKDDLTILSKINKKFDLVFCYDTFGHIPSYLSLETLRAFNRVLDKNGYCFVHFWIESEKTFKKVFWNFAYWTGYLIKRKFKKVFPVNCSSYTHDEIKELIKRSGFKYIKNIDGIYLMQKI